MKINFLQQGDVQLFRINEIPNDVIEIKNSILAEGTATGHKHQIVKGDYKCFERNGVLYLEVIEDSYLKHEEHSVKDKVSNLTTDHSSSLKSVLHEREIEYFETILKLDIDKSIEELLPEIPHETIIPPGLWEVDIVEQIDHFTEFVEKVRD